MRSAPSRRPRRRLPRDRRRPKTPWEVRVMSYESNRHKSRNARSRQVATAATAVAPVVEGLENRLLLSFTVSDRGTLVIDGTAGDDAIFVIRNTRRTSRLIVSINGAADSVAASTVRRIEIS